MPETHLETRFSNRKKGKKWAFFLLKIKSF
jgi:hypothetical protein